MLKAELEKRLEKSQERNRELGNDKHKLEKKAEELQERLNEIKENHHRAEKALSCVRAAIEAIAASRAERTGHENLDSMMHATEIPRGEPLTPNESAWSYLLGLANYQYPSPTHSRSYF